jgi:hypothetical protein
MLKCNIVLSGCQKKQNLIATKLNHVAVIKIVYKIIRSSRGGRTGGLVYENLTLSMKSLGTNTNVIHDYWPK